METNLREAFEWPVGGLEYKDGLLVPRLKNFLLANVPGDKPLVVELGPCLWEGVEEEDMPSMPYGMPPGMRLAEPGMIGVITVWEEFEPGEIGLKLSFEDMAVGIYNHSFSTHYDNIGTSHLFIDLIIDAYVNVDDHFRLFDMKKLSSALGG